MCNQWHSNDCNYQGYILVGCSEKSLAGLYAWAIFNRQVALPFLAAIAVGTGKGH